MKKYVIVALAVLCLTIKACKGLPPATPTFPYSDRENLTLLPDRPLCGLTMPDADASPWRQYWHYSAAASQPGALLKDGAWLWVGLHQGLLRLDLQTLDCTLFEHAGDDPDLSLAGVRSIMLDPRGCLWVTSAGGVVRNCADAWDKEPDWQPVPLDPSAYVGLGFDAEGNLHTYNSLGRRGPDLRYDGHEPPAEGEWSGEYGSYPFIKSPDECDDWFSNSVPIPGIRFQSPQECHALLAWQQRLDALDLPAGLTYHQENSLSSIAADSKGGWHFARRIQPSADHSEQYFLLRWVEGAPGSGDWLVVPWPFAPPGYYDTPLVVDEARSGVWIGASDGLVFSDGHTLQKFPLTAASLVPVGPGVLDVVMDRAGRLWAATKQGLLRYDAQVDDWQSTEVRQAVRITPDDQGGLWAVRSSTDLYISHLVPASGNHDGENWQHHSGMRACGIPSGIAADVDGGLWLTGRFCGLWGFDGRQLVPYHAGFDDAAALLARGPDGVVYAAGFDSDLVQRYDGANWETLLQADPQNQRESIILTDDAKTVEKTIRPVRIAPDAKGGLWVGYTQPPYLRYFIPVQGDLERQVEFSDAVGEPVLALLVAAQGDLWVGVEKALLHYDGKSWRRIPAADSFIALAEDRLGRIWAAGLEGFYVYAATGE